MNFEVEFDAMNSIKGMNRFGDFLQGSHQLDGLEGSFQLIPYPSHRSQVFFRFGDRAQGEGHPSQSAQSSAQSSGASAWAGTGGERGVSGEIFTCPLLQMPRVFVCGYHVKPCFKQGDMLHGNQVLFFKTKNYAFKERWVGAGGLSADLCR